MTSEAVPGPWTYDDYHVGWVCALPTEQTAAIAMLDQRHAGLPKPPNDNNTYTLGSVGKHSVVIACLPKGKIGNVSAATVATNMISTFPSIKFCLMVGIGGGIPPKVRLGDVVVSTPVGAFPGVVQYDLGKAHQGGTFERTGALNSPPNALLAALTMVESEHDLTGTQIPEYLKELEQKWPRLAPKYLRSESLKDQLFKANYDHISKSTADGRVVLIDDPEAEESDAEDDCRFCDTSQTVKRKPREMRVHYGLIASGNEVIKDSIFREKLNRDLGGQVLCVEMEAAGLAHNFPCITIRGICDYADSHKNKAWQAHAAAVAAAFAKELLDQVQASDVEREPTVKKVLSQIHDTVLQSDANIREVKRKMDRKEDVEILEWLTPVNYGPQQSDNSVNGKKAPASGFLAPRSSKTGSRLGRRCSVPAFLEQARQSSRIAFIYGNYRQHDEQKLDHLLKSLLKQLVQGQSSMPASLEVLYDKHNVRKTRASVEEVSATIHSISGLYSRIFIVFDALDELKETDGCRNRFLDEIFKLQAQYSAKLFTTSRFIPEIIERFEGSKTINIRAQDEDVRSFLDGKISQSAQLLQTHREMIKSEITKAVDGMFLLAQLHFQSVSTKKTLTKVKDALNSFSCGPKAYDIAYKKAMERIAGQDQDSKELATQVLSWITCARRVLKPSELQHALAVEENDVELNEENIPQVDDMVSVCSGLVTVDDKSGVIRLVHYTTQEFLDRTRDEWFPIAESEITMACVRYLSFDVFKGGFCKSRKEYEERLECNPFYGYASHNWGHHALMASMDGDQVIKDFLEGPAKLSASVQAIMVNKHPKRGHIEDISQMASAVPTAAYFGLSKMILALLEKGHPSDSRGIDGWTPLLYAARYGHEEVVKHLITRNDVELNSKDDDFGKTALSWATEEQNTAVVEVLLDKEGVDADCRDGRNDTPLLIAARKGHEAVVKLLLSKQCVDPNSTSYHDRTPLSLAAGNGNEAVVRLLLAMDTVDANRKNSYQRSTPLDYAVEGGHEAVVKLLLTKTRVTWAGRLLGSAASKGNERLLRLLVNSSAIPDREGKAQKVTVQATDKEDEYCSPSLPGQALPERTSLHWAVENGHLALVETLLQSGTAINAPRCTNRDYSVGRMQCYIEESQTAIHLAVDNGNKLMVSLLLDHGAEINDVFTCTTTSYWHLRARALAARRGKPFSRFEQVLSNMYPYPYDTYVPAKCDYRIDIVKQTAVHLAAKGGYRDVVALLLRRGAKAAVIP
ncbi:ankyrin protein [Fusarium phyllophilum]|uniref:Ankyrin protein n=1 Tax=Fusarium phyllophilum TaxID=47803 RepID=A0A8H5MT47_9HYPO|nr:ankyrin protein [Fusarium phyllophilum]